MDTNKHFGFVSLKNLKTFPKDSKVCVPGMYFYIQYK